MRAKELRERSDEELTSMESTLRQELFTAKFKNHTNRLNDSSELTKKRHDLARVLTVKRERELGGIDDRAQEAEG